MLKIRPTAWYSWDFLVLDGDREVTLLDRNPFRERATFTLEGEEYRVRRTSILEGTFVLEHGGRAIARAVKPRALRRTIEVRVGAEAFVLRPKGAFGREFRLVRGGFDAGCIRPEAILSREATVDLPESIPLPARLFMACLVLVLWKRRSDAARSG